MFEVVTLCVSKIKGELNHHGELNRKSRNNTFDLKNKKLFMCALSLFFIFKRVMIRNAKTDAVQNITYGKADQDTL
jgi:hypothetical protein